MGEINLLQQKKDSRFLSLRILHALRLTSIAFLSIVTISSIGLFIINFSSPLTSLQEEEGELASSLTSNQSKLSSMLLINSRLKDIALLLGKRTHFEKELELIISGLPQGVTLNGLELDGKKITITSSSRSLSSMNSFVDQIILVTEQNNKVFKRLTMDNFSYDTKRGLYFASFKIDVI